MNTHSKRVGFTLFELVLTIGFLAGVIAIASTMIIFSNNSQRVISQEFDIQSDMRIASEVINQEVRHATAVFMLNPSLYDSTSLKNGWNYFGVSDDGTEIIHYHWNDTLNAHDEELLVNATPGVTFNMNFSQTHSDALMVDFVLDGFFQGSTTPKVTIKSSLSALNTVVVDESGTLANPSIVLAYRSEDIPNPDKVKVSVALVLDVSGSMAWNMTGGTASVSSPSRISLMKSRAKELIDIFSDMGNVYVSLIPFSSNANSPGLFLNAKDNAVSLKASIDGYSANGGTNAGDGLRRAYHHHHSFNTSNATDQILNYTILLMDGNPTLWPTSSSSNYYGTGDISTTGGTGNENDANIANAMSYISSLATTHVTRTDPSQKVFQRSFVIGFNANQTGVDRAVIVAETYLNHSTDTRIKGKYYSATSGEELANVFKAISDVILKETWHIYGPTN